MLLYQMFIFLTQRYGVDYTGMKPLSRLVSPALVGARPLVVGGGAPLFLECHMDLCLSWDGETP